MKDLKSKVTLASRVDPALKEKVFAKAEQQGFTPSAFVESILAESVLEVIENPKESAESVLLESAIPEKSELEQKEEEFDRDELVEGFRSAMAELRQERDELLKEKEDFLNNSLQTSVKDKEEFERYLQCLRKHYDDTSDEELILGALFAACCNETKWGQYTVKSYLQRSKEERISAVKIRSE